MRLALPALLAVAACGPAAPPPTITNQPVANSAAYLIWSGSNDHARTRWIDADGNERGRADGAWIAAGHTLWHVVQTERKLATAGCDRDGDDKPDEPGSADIIDLALVSADGKDRIQLATTEPDPDVGELSYSASIHVSLGRFLTVDDGMYEDACGAHGGNVASSSTYDLASRTTRPEPWLTDQDAARFADQARPQIEDPGFDQDDPEWHVASSEPVWHGGKLSMRHLLWIDACYACGNGLWSSYTSAAWVNDDHVPDELAAEGAQVPPAVARLLDAPKDDDSIGVSWGTPDDSWRAAFAR